MKKLPNIVQFSRVEITWHDAQVSDGGLNAADYLREYTPCVRRTLGYYLGTAAGCILICETDDRLAGNLHDDTPLDVERITSIPVGMITKLSVLS